MQQPQLFDALAEVVHQMFPLELGALAHADLGLRAAERLGHRVRRKPQQNQHHAHVERVQQPERNRTIRYCRTRDEGGGTQQRQRQPDRGTGRRRDDAGALTQQQAGHQHKDEKHRHARAADSSGGERHDGDQRHEPCNQRNARDSRVTSAVDDKHDETEGVHRNQRRQGARELPGLHEHHHHEHRGRHRHHPGGDLAEQPAALGVLFACQHRIYSSLSVAVVFNANSRSVISFWWMSFDASRMRRTSARCAALRPGSSCRSCASVLTIVSGLPTSCANRKTTSCNDSMMKAYNQTMKMRVVVLGAGFGGLELTSKLREAVSDQIDLTLIDRSHCFVFGFSKLDVLFSKQTADQVQCAYRNIMKPGVRFLQETIMSIDPAAKESQRTAEPMTPMCLWWHLAPRSIRRPRLVWLRVATSSIRSAAP